MSVTAIGICLLLVLTPGRSAAQNIGQSKAKREVLTNVTVIEMVKLGLSDTVIIEKIRQSEHNFDTSLDGLKQLKAANVSNTIIAVMVNPQSAAASVSAGAANSRTAVATEPAAARNPATSYPIPADKGAYLWDGKKLHLLYQSTVPSMGANFWRSMAPFVKKKMELQLVGAQAKASFDDPQPTILVSGLGEVIPGVPAFRWLYVKTGGMRKDRRIVGTYDVGGFFGSVSRVDNEIETEIKKVAEGIYAIRPTKPLPDGEYGLVQVPKLADMSANPSFAPPIWDFGVYTEARPIERKE
jgi:hypothetical protein